MKFVLLEILLMLGCLVHIHTHYRVEELFFAVLLLVRNVSLVVVRIIVQLLPTAIHSCLHLFNTLLDLASFEDAACSPVEIVAEDGVALIIDGGFVVFSAGSIELLLHLAMIGPVIMLLGFHVDILVPSVGAILSKAGMLGGYLDLAEEPVFIRL
jgi:hypothetical protein